MGVDVIMVVIESYEQQISLYFKLFEYILDFWTTLLYIYYSCQSDSS